MMHSRVTASFAISYQGTHSPHRKNKRALYVLGLSKYSRSGLKEITMQNKLISVVRVMPIVVISGLLVLAASAAPQSESLRSTVQKSPLPPRCSARTIAGDFAYTIEGTLLLSPTVTLPIHGISLAHYDGKGNKTQLDHVVVNGQEPQEEWTAGSGTYTVNENCTGSQEVFVNGNLDSPIRSHFIIDKGGREIREVIDANAVTAIGARVE
jgi:hypothetical protein